MAVRWLGLMLASLTLSTKMAAAAWDENSFRCEICTNNRSSIEDNEYRFAVFNIRDFYSQSKKNEFYVRTVFTHTWLADMDMRVLTENGGSAYLMKDDCSSSNDLNAVFFDSWPNTVDEQGKCSEGVSTLVFSRPRDNFTGEGIGAMPEDLYIVEMFDDAGGDQGMIEEVCVGWFDESFCDIYGSVCGVATNMTIDDCDEVFEEYFSSTTSTTEAPIEVCEVCAAPDNFVFENMASAYADIHIDGFSSEGQNMSFVRAILSYSNVGDLMVEVSDGDGSAIVWNYECDGTDGLNAIFSDLFNETIEEQRECSANLSRTVTGKPYESLSDAGLVAGRAGTYRITVTDATGSNEGQIYELCVGFLSQGECSISGAADDIVFVESSVTTTEEPPTYDWTESSPRCEVCFNGNMSIRDYQSIVLEFDVADFVSESDEYEFFVSVDLEHTFLGDLTMDIEQGDNQARLWYRECSSRSDLNAVFVDSAGETVNDQDACSLDNSELVFARPNQYLLVKGIGDPYGSNLYNFSLKDNAGGDRGHLLKVCLGYFDSVGCEFAGDTSSDSSSDDDSSESSTTQEARTTGEPPTYDWTESSPRCEVCFNGNMSVRDYQTVVLEFDVAGIVSESDEYEFFVSVDLEHTYLGDLTMVIEQGDNKARLWKYDCDSQDDLNVVFVDSAGETVDDQNACSLDNDELVFAKPNQYLFVREIGDPYGSNMYNFSLKDNAGGDRGNLLKVCLGYFDSVGCVIAEDTSSDSSEGSTTEEAASTMEDEYSSQCQICANLSLETGDSVDIYEVTTVFNVSEFTSESGNYEFFVSAVIDNPWLEDFRLEVSQDDSYGPTKLWSYECGSDTDLNVMFLDSRAKTVYEKGQCASGLNTTLKARPYESMSDSGVGQLIATDSSMFAQFEVKWVDDTCQCEIGFIEQICVGFRDEVGCTLEGTSGYDYVVDSSSSDGSSTSEEPSNSESSSDDDSSDKSSTTQGPLTTGEPPMYDWTESSPRCEVCFNGNMSIRDYQTIVLEFDVAGVVSESEEYEFFVSVDLEHTFLADLTMIIEQGDNQARLWHHECDGHNDLNAVFVDSSAATVESIDACNNTELVFAKPNQYFFVRGIGDPYGSDVYNFTLRDNWGGDRGNLLQVCLGYFDSVGCEIGDTPTRLPTMSPDSTDAPSIGGVDGDSGALMSNLSAMILVYLGLMVSWML